MGEKIEIYDFILVLSLLGAAWKALCGREAFTSTVFFIVYGLLMALAWVQLGAIDVALAEASIGTGLTGALLIGAIRQFETDADVHVSTSGREPSLIVGVLAGVVFMGLWGGMNGSNEAVGVFPKLVQENLSISGTTHPVTAVLLNFRAFDTWLELGVLLLASIAAITIYQVYDGVPIPAKIRLAQDQPRIVARAMFPLLVLVGGVVLWFGSRAPGGAFQAGSLIGAAGILLQIGGERGLLQLSSLRTRFVLSAGFGSFLIVAVLTFSEGRRVLEYSPDLASLMILILEVAASLSIALTLNAMYACSHPWRSRAW